MDENQLSSIIVDTAFEIHQELGPGFLESVYESILYEELKTRGLHVERQVRKHVHWKGKVLDQFYIIDLLVEEKVVVELKSVEHVLPLHKKQVISYLKLTDLKLGLLMNFNAQLIKNGITRFVTGL